MSVIDEIAAERARQINAEGWTPEHDDKHDQGQLVSAALSYCITAQVSAMALAMGIPASEVARRDATVPPGKTWPWDAKWWKPRGPRRDLVRAAALIVAEIERLDRREPAHD